MRWNSTTGAYEPIPGAVQAPDTTGIAAPPPATPTKVVPAPPPPAGGLLALGAAAKTAAGALVTAGQAGAVASGLPPKPAPPPSPTAAWDEAANRARDLNNKAIAAYDTAGERYTKPAESVVVGPAAQAGPVTVERARDITAPDVQRATVAPVGTVEAAGVQRAVVAPTGNITGTTIGRTEDQQTRSQQELSIQALQDAAAGRVPSAAERQAELLTDRAIKQQFALGTALQGTNAGSALRAATKGGAEAQLNIAADAYAQRAGEQAGARRDLASTLGAVRGQDIGVATDQAKLAQEANIRNQQTDLQTKLAQGDIDQKTFSQASANLQNARVQNQQMELQRALTQGEIDKATFIARSQLLFDAAAKNQAADVTTNVAQGNISANIATSNVAEANKVAIAQAGLDKDVNLANQLAALDQMKIDDVRKAELGRQAIESAKVFQAAVMGKDDAQSKAAHIAAVQRQLDQAYEGMKNAQTAAERQFWAGIIAAAMGAGGALGAAFVTSKPGTNGSGVRVGMDPGATVTGGNSDPYSPNDPSYGSDIGSGLSGTDIYNGVGGTNPGTVGSDPTAPWDPYAESDIRSKKNIKPGTNAIEELCNQLEEQLFQYKNPGRHGEGMRVGIMAQDAQKSPMGREFVVDGETLKLDIANALGAALASAANNHRRLKKLEGRDG